MLDLPLAVANAVPDLYREARIVDYAGGEWLLRYRTDHALIRQRSRCGSMDTLRYRYNIRG